MPIEKDEHDEPKNLVEESTELETEAARSLQDAADSHHTLQGFYALNDVKDSEELEREVRGDEKKPEDREEGQPVP